MYIKILDNRIFALNTKNSSYIIATDNNGILRCLHWGETISNIDDFKDYTFQQGRSPVDVAIEECSSFGTMHFKEASLKVSFPDGTRDFRYKLSNSEKIGNELILTLKDIFYPFAIKLHYKVYPENDIIEKWREAIYTGNETVVLERFHSAEFGLPETGYSSINFNGMWGAEFKKGQSQIVAGKTVYESLHGVNAHTCNPFFALHKNADEEKGKVYFGSLAYSGNFKIVAEATECELTSILAGISDTDFEIVLTSGENFETPHVFAGYTSQGFGGMSQLLNRFSHDEIMPKEHAKTVFPVMYNSWYATTFDVLLEEQKALADTAKELGVEIFVVDDGWFRGRNNDTAGLGDWTPDKAKFPDGLTPLISYVNDLGMDFGLWIEPEMANPDSDLFRNHPDWVLQYPNRDIVEGRNQYILDIANPDVLNYLKDCFDTLIRENNIKYIKWDRNRYAAEMGSPTCAPEESKQLWHRCTTAFYSLITFLRNKHPQVIFESCASGGGRVDYGSMACFDSFWTSDNTDPLDRLTIQENYSLLYPIKYMMTWITDDFEMNHRNIPLTFAAHAAMCGSFGIGNNLKKKSQQELDEIAGHIKTYKEIRETVQFGDFYRLKSFSSGDLHAVQYCKGEQSVLFAFLKNQHYGWKPHRLSLRGLQPNKQYSFTINDKLFQKSGEYLMHHGIVLELKGDYDSAIIIFNSK